jgi:hypothetical protein
MQTPDGSLDLMTNEKIARAVATDSFAFVKIIHEGMYFKIKRTYFKITKIHPNGIEADGVSRKEYFKNRKFN